MSWNKSTVTDSGVVLLNESLAGHTLTITSAVGGAGTLDDEALKAATDVVDKKQTFNLLGIEDFEQGKRIGIQITNKGILESYILHQIGVRARLEYQEEESLLFILQDDRGIEIPAEVDNPGFLFEVYAVIAVSNNANITISTTSGAIASVEYVVEKISAEIIKHNADKNSHKDIREEIKAVKKMAEEAGESAGNAISNDQIGVPGGVASLGKDGKVPKEQLPTLDYIPTTEKGKPGGVATLGPDGKVPGEQLPKMDYDPAGSAEAVQKNLTAHTGNKNNPHAVTAEQVGALASSGGVMSGAISMSGHKIANLAAPADSTDAANKQYVDEHAGARVILGSYVGTGKTGKSNPNQITLAEPFKILCIYGMQSNNYYKSIDGYGNGETSNIIHSSIIPTEYTKGISFGFGYRYSSRDSYGKKSTDGKTFSWYFDLTTPDATSEQLNASGTVYYYYAIV